MGRKAECDSWLCREKKCAHSQRRSFASEVVLLGQKGIAPSVSAEAPARTYPTNAVLWIKMLLFVRESTKQAKDEIKGNPHRRLLG